MNEGLEVDPNPSSFLPLFLVLPNSTNLSSTITNYHLSLSKLPPTSDRTTNTFLQHLWSRPSGEGWFPQKTSLTSSSLLHSYHTQTSRALILGSSVVVLTTITCYKYVIERKDPIKNKRQHLFEKELPLVGNIYYGTYDDKMKLMFWISSLRKVWQDK